ncbi:hypothetical protein EAE99_011072 [Botrytis elliptica]|nr:hypothetical protein EAE99_011072 [Botrytis elliptica]
MDTLWPTIQAANRDCPAHARVLRSFIIIASADKPFPRAGKETIQRASVPVLYAEELERLYSEKAAVDTQGSLIEGVDYRNLKHSLHDLVATNFWLQGDLDDEMDFFEAGLDSLQLSGFIKQINAFLRTVKPGSEPVSTETIFANSSIDRLSEAIEIAGGER